MKRYSKLSVTLTYDEWATLINVGLIRAIDGHPKTERPSERAMAISKVASITKKLRLMVATKVARRGGIKD